MKEETIKETCGKGFNLFGCKECDEEMDNEREAIEHCVRTGHKVWWEYSRSKNPLKTRLTKKLTPKR